MMMLKMTAKIWMVNRRSIAQLSDVHTRPPSCCLQLYFAEEDQDHEDQDHGDQNGDDDHDQWYSGPPSCGLQLNISNDEDGDLDDQNGEEDHGYSDEQLSKQDNILTTNDLYQMDIASEAELI